MRIRAAEGKLALLLRCTRRTHLLRLVVPQQMHQCRHERIQVRLCLIEHDLCLTTDVVVRRHERIDHLLILLDASHFACLKPLRLNAQGGHAGWSYSAATCMYGCGAATLAAAARCSCVRVAGVAARSTPTVRGACRRRTEPRATRKAASGAGYDDASMRGVSVPENHTCFPSHVRPSRRNSAAPAHCEKLTAQAAASSHSSAVGEDAHQPMDGAGDDHHHRHGSGGEPLCVRPHHPPH